LRKASHSRGAIFYANLQGFDGLSKPINPVLIISNDVGNRHSPTVICYVGIQILEGYIKDNNLVQRNLTFKPYGHLSTIDKCRLIKPLGRLDKLKMELAELVILQTVYGFEQSEVKINIS
jgi:mRNA-degrading endonuclease toxin of MazEF toxin-antitoxin module